MMKYTFPIFTRGMWEILFHTGPSYSLLFFFSSESHPEMQSLCREEGRCGSDRSLPASIRDNSSRELNGSGSDSRDLASRICREVRDVRFCCSQNSRKLSISDPSSIINRWMCQRFLSGSTSSRDGRSITSLRICRGLLGTTRCSSLPPDACGI